MGGKTAEQPKKKKGGCLRMLQMLLFLILLSLVGGIYFIFEPQDLSDIQGYRKDESTAPGKVRNLEFVLKSAWRNNTGATISEKELNDYLGRTLELKQEGLLKDYVTLKGVWVRLEDGWVEVIIEREIAYQAFKRRHTIAMHFEIVQLLGEDGQVTTGINPAGHGGTLFERVRLPNAGRFGRVPIVEGYLHLVKKSFLNLNDAYPGLTGKDPDGPKEPKEVGILLKMLEEGTRMTIEEGRLVIQPAPESQLN